MEYMATLSKPEIETLKVMSSQSVVILRRYQETYSKAIIYSAEFSKLLDQISIVSNLQKNNVCSYYKTKNTEFLARAAPFDAPRNLLSVNNNQKAR